MGTARQLDRDIAKFLASDGARTRAHAERKLTVARQPDRETKTSEDHPGPSPPMQYELDVGRDHDGHKPLYWKKVLAEHKKESERGDGNMLQLDLWVMHAPDRQTPFTRVDWPDPLDARGAEKFARQLVEDGGAEVTYVYARARRGYGGKGRAPIWTLAVYAREPPS
jgi:hypothetical protein